MCDTPEVKGTSNDVTSGVFFLACFFLIKGPDHEHLLLLFRGPTKHEWPLKQRSSKQQTVKCGTNGMP